MSSIPVVALTQGDPAGVGPEIVCKLLAAGSYRGYWQPLVVAERPALQSVTLSMHSDLEDRWVFLDGHPTRQALAELSRDQIPVLDPIGEARQIVPGKSRVADAAGAVAALDAAVSVVQTGVAEAVVTAPVSKESIARHHLPDFRGHTEYLAQRAGLGPYGRDYLMTFLTADLQVALLTTHLALSDAVAAVDSRRIVEALHLLERCVGGRIAVAGLNPHAGEGGLMGDEEMTEILPAVRQAREAGVEVSGPESPDSLFARARGSEFDWVLALYHDQGLIAVKTASFGAATNWTLGLPFLRTSVDHGTAFRIAGQGIADARPLAQVVETTLRLIAGLLPRGRAREGLKPASSPP